MVQAAWNWFLNITGRNFVLKSEWLHIADLNVDPAASQHLWSYARDQM